MTVQASPNSGNVNAPPTRANPFDQFDVPPGATSPPITFIDYSQFGYRLVPIVPPDAVISERSSMAKRKDARGKAVGVRGRDGKWFGFDWIPHESTEDDLARWQAMGAGIGVKTGQGLIGIDADALNEAYARIIRDTIEARLGIRLPIRVGRYPKALYLCRVSEPMRYVRIEFGELDDKGRLKDRVEILSEGRQFVAAGIHNTTGKPYTWAKPLVPFNQLPVFSPAVIIAVLEELRTLLPAAKPLIHEGAETSVDQNTLKGDIALVRKAVELTPNTSEHFPTRESYRDFGYAIRAALPDDESAAFDIFSEWCDRWQEGTNDPDIVAADWSRMRPPYRRGANWLFELAEQHAPEKFSRAEVFFQPIPEDDSPFAMPSASVEAERRPLEWIDPTKWEGQSIPPREWEVEGWIPKNEVTLLYGDGGVGKTLLAHQYATCAATGHDWLGQKTRPARVMCFFCEDSEAELHRRQRDINTALGVSFPDLSQLRLISRKHKDNLFALWDRHTGAMKRQAVWAQVRGDAIAFAADVLIVDTIADTYSGSEIDRAQVSAFIKSCLGRLAEEIGGSVIALGHPSQAGKSSGQGTSGSTAWSNAARSRLYLRHPAGADRGNIRELEGMKLNYGPKGSLLKLRWARGAFEVLAGSRPADASSTAAPVTMKSVGDAAEDAVISVLLSNGAERLSLTRRSAYYAPKVLRRCDPDTLAPFTQDEVATALESLERRKVIKPDVVGRDGSYRPVHGFVVVQDNLSAVAVVDPGVFT